MLVTACVTCKSAGVPAPSPVAALGHWWGWEHLSTDLTHFIETGKTKLLCALSLLSNTLPSGFCCYKLEGRTFSPIAVKSLNRAPLPDHRLEEGVSGVQRPQASVCSCPPAYGCLLPLVLHLNNEAPWGRENLLRLCLAQWSCTWD